MPADGMDKHTNLFRVTVLFNFLLATPAGVARPQKAAGLSLAPGPAFKFAVSKLLVPRLGVPERSPLGTVNKRG